jgi:Fe-S oxidoreductase
MDRFFGLSCHRPFPRFAPRASVRAASIPNSRLSLSDRNIKILFLRDTFNHYFYPEVEVAALRIFGAAGIDVKFLPILSAGRTLISKGFLPAAKKHAAQVIDAIHCSDPQGLCPIIGLEPSEIYTLRYEYLDFFPEDDSVSGIADRAWMIDEFFIRANLDLEFSISNEKVYLHGHCYQKSQPPAADGLPTGVGASVELLKIAGYAADVIDDGCCGMAGAFGYEAEHYDTSYKVGELALFPALRAIKQAGQEVLVSAPGVSCRAQIEDGTGLATVHPIQLVERALRIKY